MSARRPFYEIVTTDAEQPFHVRLVATNGARINVAENLTSKRHCRRSIEISGESFGLSSAQWSANKHVVNFLTPRGHVVFAVVREVDEREQFTDAQVEAISASVVTR